MPYKARHRGEPALGTVDLDASPEARKRRLTRNIVWNYSSGFVSVFGLVILYPFAVRIAGASQYGLWVLIFGTVQLLSTADFGLGTGVVRQLGELLRGGEPYTQRQRFVTVSMTLFSSLAVLLTGLYTAVFPLYLQTIPARDEVKATEHLAVAAGAFALFATILARGANSILWAEDRQDIERKSSVVGMGVRVAGYAVTAACGWGFTGVIVSEVASLLVIPLVCITAVARRYPFPDFAPVGFRRYVKPLVSLSSVLFVGSLANLAAFQLPVYMVSSSLGLAATTAFGAVMRIYQSSRLLISWVANPFIQQIAASNREELAPRARQCYYLAGGMGALLAVGISGLAQDVIVAWLGSPFAFAGPALAFVGLGVLADAITQPSALVVNLRGNPWKASLLSVLALLLTIGAILPATNARSLTLVMLAATSAPLIVSVLFARFAVAELGGDPFRGQHKRIFVAAAGLAGLYGVLRAISWALSPWLAIGAAAVVVGIPAGIGALLLHRRRRSARDTSTPEHPHPAEVPHH